MDKAIMFGMLAFAATLLVAGGSIYAKETGNGNGSGQDRGFECPMHDAMEKAGYGWTSSEALNITSMEEMHKAMHGNGTGCQMRETAGKNFTGKFTDMEEMHKAMHGNSTGGCPMMQGKGMMNGSGMMEMMQRGR